MCSKEWKLTRYCLYNQCVLQLGKLCLLSLSSIVDPKVAIDRRNRGRKSSEVWIAYLGRKSENYLMPWSDLFVYSLDLLLKKKSLGSPMRLQCESGGSWVIAILYGAELRWFHKMRAGLTDLLSFLTDVETGWLKCSLSVFLNQLWCNER